MGYEFVSTTNTLIIKDGKGLFIKRDENLEDFPGWLMLPGGKQQEGETIEQAAIRETQEETGLTIVNPVLKVIATHDHLYKSKIYLVFIFVASEFSGDLIDYEKDKGKPVWMDIDLALNDEKLYPDLRRHIALIQENTSKDIIFTYHKFDKDLKIIDKK